MPETKVHVIDDDEAMRDSLRFLLETSDLKVETYESASSFLAAVEGGIAGCIVTDVRMPGISGMELVRALQTQGGAPPIIMITGHGDVPLAVEAMKAGVVDFLEKPFDDDALLAAIRRAMAVRSHAEGQETESGRLKAVLSQLSPRERDVLRGVVDGKPNKIIAHELGISPRTVEVYRANVMTKTGAAGLSELVRITILAGF